jgi:hypothetical protein
MQAPNARSKASVLRRAGSPLLNAINVGSSVHACLSDWKALSCVFSYLNGVSFCVSRVSGKALVE